MYILPIILSVISFGISCFVCGMKYGEYIKLKEIRIIYESLEEEDE